jgi:N-Dimethylarginine dimethylaminohydrolase
MQVLEQDVGAVLDRMKPVPGLPDLVFTANAGVVVGNKAVPSRFRYPERQREEAYFEDWFRGQGYEVVTLDSGHFFEGAGDLLGFPDTWFGGYRQRSDIHVFSTLSDWFHREVIPLELVDNRFYHLDTCLCPLSGGELLISLPPLITMGKKLLPNGSLLPDVFSCRRLRLFGLPAMPSVSGNMWCCRQAVRKQNPC